MAKRANTHVVRVFREDGVRMTSRPKTRAQAEKIAANIRAAGVMEGSKVTSVIVLPLATDFINALALR